MTKAHIRDSKLEQLYIFAAIPSQHPPPSPRERDNKSPYVKTFSAWRTLPVLQPIVSPPSSSRARPPPPPPPPHLTQLRFASYSLSTNSPCTVRPLNTAPNLNQDPALHPLPPPPPTEKTKIIPPSNKQHSH